MLKGYYCLVQILLSQTVNLRYTSRKFHCEVLRNYCYPLHVPCVLVLVLMHKKLLIVCKLFCLQDQLKYVTCQSKDIFKVIVPMFESKLTFQHSIRSISCTRNSCTGFTVVSTSLVFPASLILLTFIDFLSIYTKK